MARKQKPSPKNKDNKRMDNNNKKSMRSRFNSNSVEKYNSGNSESKWQDYTEYPNAKGNGNHPQWYKTNEQIARDVASLPFGYQLGARKSHGLYGEKFNDFAVPGIMRINYMPTYGHLDNITAPLNIASRNIYTFLKSVNSRGKTYDAPDIALYLIAVDNLIAFHEWMKRIYGLLNVASITNRYYAEAAVRAAGGDYSDLLANINDFRAFINQFALRISTLPIPAEMSIFARHSWLNGHVWYDSANPSKAQTYVINPTGFWRYELDDRSAGSVQYMLLHEYQPELQTQKVRGRNEMPFTVIKNFGEDLLASVLYGAGDEDFNLMGGDILYAYGESKIFRASTISEDYSVMPSYDPWVCDQINNIRCYGAPDYTANYIKQDEDMRYLEHMVSVTLPDTIDMNGTDIMIDYPWNYAVMDQYINIFDSDTSSDHVLSATRLLSIPIAVGNNGERIFQFLSLASEYVENYCIYQYATYTGRAADWALNRSPLYKTIHVSFTTANPHTNENVTQFVAESTNGTIDFMAKVSNFDRRPINYFASIDILGSQIEKTHYIPDAFIDLNNYSIISYDVLKQMNDSVLLAMFGIDEFGTQISLK